MKSSGNPESIGRWLREREREKDIQTPRQTERRKRERVESERESEQNERERRRGRRNLGLVGIITSSIIGLLRLQSPSLGLNLRQGDIIYMSAVR
jgi:hypothetical protein